MMENHELAAVDGRMLLFLNADDIVDRSQERFKKKKNIWKFFRDSKSD